MLGLYYSYGLLAKNPSVVRVGHPLIVCLEALKGQSIVSVRNCVGLSIDLIAKVTCCPRCLLNTYDESHKATTEVQWTSGFIPTSHCQQVKSKWYTHSLVSRPPPFFCSSVCVQYNTRKRKSMKNGESLGTPIT